MPQTSTTTQAGVHLPTSIVWEPDGKEMILIPAGTFLMGRDDGPERVRPQHEIHLESFYIDRYPVTQAQYHRFIQDTGHPIPCYQVEWLNTDEYNWDPEKNAPPAGKGDHPVVLVSWEDARAYSTWADKRLPTEAEWERTARGREGQLWPWGNHFVPGHCNIYSLGLGQTTAVGRFSPQGDSSEGVGDLVGNVWEWTSSLFWPYPYDAQDGREDPLARGWRVLRGGSWFNDPDIANATSRLDGDFVFYTNVGFRCAVPAGRILTNLVCNGKSELDQG